MASETLGVSARHMLEALVSGTHDPEVLADLARGRLHAKLAVDGHHVVFEEPGASTADLGPARAPAKPNEAAPSTAEYCQILPTPFQVADVHGVDEHLLTDDVGALVGALAAHCPQIAQRPLGERAALGGRGQLGGGQAHRRAVQPGAHQHPVHPAVGHLPTPEARQRQRRGDGARPVGGVLHGVADDGVDQRRGQAPCRSRRWARLGQQTSLAVGAVALAQLVEPRPRHAVLAARHNRHLPPLHPVQPVLAGACDTRRRGHGHASAVRVRANGECCLWSSSSPGSPRTCPVFTAA
ncbi:MAG: hypothetical protein M3O70_20910 [Actinomycetota bacterium]|nr:hypothetical protein [Actinomycetota bacterium]